MIKENVKEDLYYLPIAFKEDSYTEIQELIEQVKKEIEYNWISFYSIDLITGTLNEIELEKSGFNLIDNIQFENGSGLAAWVAEQQRPILLSSVHRGQRFRSNPVKSFVCCPIVRNGMTVGILNLGHVRNNTYNTQVLRRLLQILNPHEMEE